MNIFFLDCGIFNGELIIVNTPPFPGAHNYLASSPPKILGVSPPAGAPTEAAAAPLAR